MSEMMSVELAEIDEVIDSVIDELIVVLSDEPKEMLNKTSQTLISEIAVEDPLELKTQLRMCVEKFQEM